MNRSEVVGRPLAALLANDGACVYSVDITGVQKFTRGEGLQKRTHEVVDLEGKTLKDVVPLCDVVITGVPSDKYKFDTSLLREGAVCVNFSSEKVCFSFIALSFDEDVVVADYSDIELPPRGPRQGLALCSLYWKGHHCRPVAEPAGMFHPLFTCRSHAQWFVATSSNMTNHRDLSRTSEWTMSSPPRPQNDLAPLRRHRRSLFTHSHLNLDGHALSWSSLKKS